MLYPKKLDSKIHAAKHGDSTVMDRKMILADMSSVSFISAINFKLGPMVHQNISGRPPAIVVNCSLAIAEV